MLPAHGDNTQKGMLLMVQKLILARERSSVLKILPLYVSLKLLSLDHILSCLFAHIRRLYGHTSDSVKFWHTKIWVESFNVTVVQQVSQAVSHKIVCTTLLCNMSLCGCMQNTTKCSHISVCALWIQPSGLSGRFCPQSLQPLTCMMVTHCWRVQWHHIV